MLSIRLAKALLPAVFFILGCNPISSGSLPKALLWKIEGPAIETSYLFGTIHIMPRSEFEIQANVADAFKSCEQLVLELDIDDINIQTEVLRYASMKDDVTLSSLITGDEYEVVEEAVRETLGLGLANFGRFKPFVISTFLISRYIDEAPASFELTFARMAEEEQKPVEGLETIEEQMAVFDRIPYAEQARELVDMVVDEEKIKADYNELLKMYKSQNLDGIYDIMLTQMTSEDQVEELLTKRNKAWIPQIGQLAAGKETLFAVGAGHLPGDEGLIELLRAEGYSVTPL